MFKFFIDERRLRGGKGDHIIKYLNRIEVNRFRIFFVFHHLRFVWLQVGRRQVPNLILRLLLFFALRFSILSVSIDFFFHNTFNIYNVIKKRYRNTHLREIHSAHFSKGAFHLYIFYENCLFCYHHSKLQFGDRINSKYFHRIQFDRSKFVSLQRADGYSFVYELNEFGSTKATRESLWRFCKVTSEHLSISGVQIPLEISEKFVENTPRACYNYHRLTRRDTLG